MNATPDITWTEGLMILAPYFGCMFLALVVAIVLAPVICAIDAKRHGECPREAIRIFIHTEIWPLAGMEEERCDEQSASTRG